MREERLHGSKFVVHLSGSCEAMLRSTPEIGGPLTRTHKQGCPNALRALQHASLGGMELNGATAALQGMSCTSAEKNVLVHALLSTSATKPTIIIKIHTNDTALIFIFELFLFCISTS